MRKFMIWLFAVVMSVGITVPCAAAAYGGGTELIYAADSSELARGISSMLNEYDAGTFRGGLAANSVDGSMLRIIAKTVSPEKLCHLSAVKAVYCPDGFSVLQFDSAEKLDYALEKIENDNDFIYAVRDETVFAVEDESAVSSQSTEPMSWGVSALQADLYSAYLADTGKTSSVIVAVVDSGVANLDFFSGRMVAGYDFVDNDTDASNDMHASSHGTHVAGTIVDCTQENNVKIMPVRVLRTTNGSLAAVTGGIRFAADNGAGVINLSLGGIIDGHEAIDDAVNYAFEKGVCCVTCSGNDSKDSADFCPAHNPNALTFSSVRKSLNFSDGFSNYGDEVDFCAPGESIYGLNASGEKIKLTGTSQAASFGSACAALILVGEPGLSPAGIKQKLISCSIDLGKSGKDKFFGYGFPKLGRFIPGLSIDVDSVELDVTSKTLYPGQSFTLWANVIPSDATDTDVSWSSSDSSVARVDNSGTVTAVGTGTAVITVTTAQGGFTAECTVTVAENKVVKLTVASAPYQTRYYYKSSKPLNLDGLSLTAEYADGSVKKITDTSSLKTSGFDTGKAGRQNVTVYYDGACADFTVNIKYSIFQWIIIIVFFGWIWYI